MAEYFLNGPIQNGDFTFHEKPGKSVGILASTALNRLFDIDKTPHLWNTVMLANDRAYRSAKTDTSRDVFEHDRIMSKYNSDAIKPGDIITDADDNVSNHALEVIEQSLIKGDVSIRNETIQICHSCHHMTGNSSSCKACGGTKLKVIDRNLLVFDRAHNQTVLEHRHIYGNVSLAHLRGIAQNVPETLILSRTRSYGIELGALGLKDLVLDPRTSLHFTHTETALTNEQYDTSMLLTQGAAANIAAYFTPFRNEVDPDLKYAIHGYVPFASQEYINVMFDQCRMDDRAQEYFMNWFLPIASLHFKNNISEEQAVSLVKYFNKAYLAATTSSNETTIDEIRNDISDGDTSWILNKKKIAAALFYTLSFN